ncbi:ABC transporter ATP-binding protein [Mesorhizobium sp. BR115XR7A]|uniref:ABC transporter ATP-binding protein n=1 Tax=Mesorhizobium sp. BR115XR7A TaxID=2876645 RepID=UPI001CC9EC41|nr:ABC transporter ATP-binding protein [Mesorhizobium sp. BR115XR7A]MBZ9905320.1 ABC transporter ATP-binding protein [Mesorhizobium sp. BR115XR7A]MBZ9930392.1 ABC transporter ATP-binding protein [Mesorhizobium sp. BR1-1-5]
MSKIPRLSVRHLTKRFAALIANDDISLDVMPGELHCLLGENGAGKSTLSSCLYGLYQPDAGEIRVDGKTVQLRSPGEAIRAGIGMVHQHFVLVPGFTVLENVAVGTGSGWRLGRAGALSRIKAICSSYGVSLDPHQLVGDLSVGEQQWVEIVKALYTGARLLILDEPTAVLTPEESRRLFAILRRLTSEDLSVVLISHKMAEVMQSDQVSVLRKGRLVGTVVTSDVSRDQLTTMMVGRSVAAPARAADAKAPGGTVLSVRGLTQLRDQRPVLDNASLDIAAGEIVGIAGVSGNGQDELFECLAGLTPPDSGTILLDGEKLQACSPAMMAAKGLGYVPSDRFRDGLVADLDIGENLVLGQQWQARWRNGPFIDAAALDANARTAIGAYSIAATGPSASSRKLSGGNAQKVILAREFAKANRLLLCNQPTRGLDIGATEFVHRRLLRKRVEGCAILLASEELEDLFALSRRICVMFRGRILAVLDTEKATYDEIGSLMAGHGSEAAA